MSRVGKLPIKVPEKVKVNIQKDKLLAEGPLGKQEVSLDPLVEVSMADGTVLVKRKEETALGRCRQGLIRNLVRNAVEGVGVGFKRELDIIGVGFRAEVKGQNLVMTLGFSHLVEFPIPAGVKITVDKQTHLTVAGASKHLVGETSAIIRKFRQPEPYKGKGIRYSDEVIRKKVGKSAAASGGK